MTNQSKEQAKELKPCPFCGTAPEAYQYESVYIIKCPSCVTVELFEDIKHKEDVIAEWNTRKSAQGHELEKAVNEREEKRKRIRELEDDIAKLESKKKIEIEEIKHLNKLAQEKRDIELDKEKHRLAVEFQQKEAKLQAEFTAKVEKLQLDMHKEMTTRFAEELKNLKEIYKDLIQRLPNLNMEIKQRQER